MQRRCWSRRDAQRGRHVHVGLFEVEKAARGFVDVVVVARQGFRRITRDEGCSFTEITGRRGNAMRLIGRREPPGENLVPLHFHLAGLPSILVQSREEKKITAEKPIQSNFRSKRWYRRIFHDGERHIVASNQSQSVSRYSLASAKYCVRRIVHCTSIDFVHDSIR